MPTGIPSGMPEFMIEGPGMPVVIPICYLAKIPRRLIPRRFMPKQTLIRSHANTYYYCRLVVQ